MELELGLKITKTRDDIDSISEFQFMKDAGPVFHSRETNTMFILTANLKGYKRSNIDMKISKDGSKISISGKKPIQEMVMMGWVMQRKVVDVKAFAKVFKIPHGVNLDKIKANHNEEECMLSIFMPKLVKGICGLKIEEHKEQEKSEVDHVSSSVGETSQKGSKDSEFQHVEGSENAKENMLDDVKKEIDKEIISQKEVRGSKLRVEDGNDDVIRNIREKEETKLRIEDSKIKYVRENDGKETYEALKTLEDMKKMLNETNKKINEETKQNEVGDSKVRIEDGNGDSAREEVGKEEYEVMKKSEQDHGIGEFISNKIEDTSKDKEFDDQTMDSRSVDKRHDGVNGDIIGSTIIKEKEESKFSVEDIKVKDIGKGISHNIVDISQRVFEESMIQQSGESKQKESKEPFEESVKESSVEAFEAMEVLEIEQNVVDHVPSNIGCINQNEFVESRIPQTETTKTTKGKMNGGECEKFPFESNQDFQKEIMKPKMNAKDGDRECVTEKLDSKEGLDDEMVTLKNEFPKHLTRSTSKENGGLNVEKMEETKSLQEEMITKEVDYFVEKGRGERFKKMHMEEKKGSNKTETTQEKVKESENGLKESGQGQFAVIKGSKGFNFANKEEQNEVINDAIVENESLIVEGYEYKEKTKEIAQDEEDKIEYGIVKLKGEGSTKIYGDPNVPFEEENVNKGIFDGRKTQKFHEIEQTEDVNEKGENIEKSMNKVYKEKYEKVQIEENEGFDITKKKDERFLQEETSKGISKVCNDAREDFPMKMLDLPIGTTEGLKHTRIEKIIGVKESVKESSMEPFEARKVSKLEPFEANDDVHKDFIKPKRETRDGELECVGKKANEEAFDAKITINEEFPMNLPKSTHEENEGLNVLKMQEIKDVKENVVKRKGKKIEYFKENDEGDIFTGMDMKTKKVHNTRETMQEKIGKSENGIKEGGNQHVAEIKGSKGLNVANSEEEESKKRSKEIEQDEENISHNIVDTSHRVLEESLIQQSGESKQKEIGRSKYDSKERLEEILKENSMEQSLVEHIHSNIGCIDQNELREPMVPPMEKTNSTRGKMNEGKESEKTPFEVINEDVEKTLFGDTIQKKIKKIGEEFPKNLPQSVFDESEGLSVQKIQETRNVKEEMEVKEIEYFMEKGKGERFKRVHRETKKENTRETVQEEIEKSENENKESGQQHEKENTIKEMDEVSKNVARELKQNIVEIDESKGFNVAKEEEQKDVMKKALVENEYLMEKLEGEESIERIKAKKIQDEEDKIEFGIVKLKGEGPTKIHADGRRFQEKEESKDVNENGAKTEKFGKNFNKKIQNEVDEDFKKCVTKERDECYLPEEVSERRSHDTKDAKENFTMKMLDSQIDTREELKDRMLEKIKGLKENEKVVPCVKKVNLEEEFKERTKAIVQDEEEKIEYGKVKLKGEGSTKVTQTFEEKEETEDVNKNSAKTKKLAKKVNEKIQYEEDEDLKKSTTKEKDECYFLEEVNERRSQDTTDAKEDFPMKMLDSQIDTREELKDRKIEKIKGVIEESEFKERTKTIVQDEEDKIEYGIVERGEGSSNITHKFQEKGEIEDDNEKGAKIEKFAKKGNEKIQNEEDESFKKSITKEKDEFFLQEEMSKGISKASKTANEPYDDRIEKEISNQNLESFEELAEKENVDIGIFDGRKIKKFQEMKQTQDTKGKGVNSEKTMEKDECYLEGEMSKGRSQESRDEKQYIFSMNSFDSPADSKEKLKDRKIEKTKGVKEESEEVKQVEEKEGWRNDIEEQNCCESMTKEELQESEIERIGTPVREFKSVECMGFKEFYFECEKDKKHKTKMLPKKFESKEIDESNDESMDQENFSPKKLELEEKCTVGIESAKEVETKDDRVINPISVPRFQSEVEEKDKSCEGNKAKYKGYREVRKGDPTKDVGNLIEMKEKEANKEEKSEFHDGEKVEETMLEKTDEHEKKIDDREQEDVARDDGKVDTKEKDMFKEYKATQNGNGEKCEMDGEIEKSGIEKVDKKKWIHDTMKTTPEKEHSVKFEVDEEEEESLNEGLKDGIVEMKTKKPLELRNSEEHGYGTEEIEAPKTMAYEGAKPSKLQIPRLNQQSKDGMNRKSECVIEEDEAKKESPKLSSVETEKIDILQPQFLDGKEKFLNKREVPKVVKSEEAKNTSKNKRESGKMTQTTEEKKHKVKEITSQFDKASGSKRVAEKVHETLKSEHQRESEEVTSKMEVETSTTFEKISTKKIQRKEEPHELTNPPNMHCEIPKEKEFRKENGQEHIQILEASISKEKEDRDQQHVQEKNDKKGFQTPKSVEAEKVLKKREGPKVAKGKEQKKKESEGPMVPKLAEKVHETPERELKRETEESISKIEVEPPTTVERKEAHELTMPPNMNYRIPKVEEAQKEEEGERHNHVPEATISKEEGTQVTTAHSIENTIRLEVAAGKQTQQFEVEGEGNTKEKKSKMDIQDSTKSKTSQVVEQCLNKDKEAKYGIEEQREGKDETSEGKMDSAKISKTIEEEKILKKREGPKVAESGSKRVSEEVHEHERKSEESTSKIEVEPPATLERKEMERNIHVLEATISKEDEAQAKATHSKEKMAQQSKVPTSLCTQQLQVEGEEKTKKKECKMTCQVEQCINKEHEEKDRIEEIEEEKDYDKVYEEEKEGKDEASGGKKENAKISKKLLVPLVIAGSALLATLAFIFVRHRRSRKM